MNKTYLLKCEKWYSSTMSIFSEGRRIGTYIPGIWNTTYKVLIGDLEIIVKKKSVFSENLLIYSNNELVAEVQNFPFRNRSIITSFNNDSFELKSNTWNNKYQISDNEGIKGEFHQQMISSTLTIDESISEFIVAAIIAQTHIAQEAAIMIACFLPLFIVIIS